MAEPIKMEFAVQMTCQSCVEAVRKSLSSVEGVQIVDINLENEHVVVESSLSSAKVKELIEQTGRPAVLKGMGSLFADTSESSGGQTTAAVAILEAGSDLIKGVARFVQKNNSTCIIEGTVDGLNPGKHALCIHECGDISQGCQSCGDVFLGLSQKLSEKPAGELGDIIATETGRTEFRIETGQVKVWDIIGRSMLVHSLDTSQVHRNTPNDNRLVCGIIARSAGIFQNTKKICSCDGVTIWDERNKPVAGAGRQSKV
ncbi:hypothetical protein ACJMK2_030790 [Sinanodonta woodiana]|uniref:Superoxide dismutase copper chaperone n=1 Tax=Sinanodonta woodiana TaxID=1069815 RepID=A0ABD3X0S2_SINWO